MTIAISASGTATSTVGTEQTLGSDTTPGVFTFQADLTAMAAGDVVELRFYTTVLSGGSSKEAWKMTFGPAPPTTPVVIFPPLPSDVAVSVSLKQTAGAARAFPWKLQRM